MKLKVDGFWYLASPYSGTPDEMEWRAFEAKWFMGQLLTKEGIITYSPIWSMHHISQTHALPKDAEYWARFNNLWMDLSIGTIVACMPGWQTSVGVMSEIDYTLVTGKPVRYATRVDGVDWIMVSEDYAS